MRNARLKRKVNDMQSLIFQLKQKQFITEGTGKIIHDDSVVADDMQHGNFSKKKSRIRQILFGILANLIAISPGMSLGFSAVALPQMKLSDGIDDNTASWIASLAAIATPLGCILSGPILDRYGRKMAMLAPNIPCLLGWLFLTTASKKDPVMLIYIGRILTGFGTGLGSIPATVYIGEITDQNMRGMLVTWTSIFIALGIFIVYILGLCIQNNWRLIAGISSIFPVVAACVTFLVLPESPVWLISRGKIKQAKSNLCKSRGVKSKENAPRFVSQEIIALTLKTTQSNKRNKTGILQNLKAFSKRACWKPLLIMNIYFLFQQYSGTFVVIFYAVDVVHEAGVSIDGYIATVLIGATRLLVTIIISYVSKLYGRRPLSIISGSGMTLSMGSLATFLFLVNNNIVGKDIATTWSWFPVTALLVYILMSTAGFLTLPFAMIGEVFPAKIRGLASGITTCCAYVFSFTIVKAYPDMLQVLGKHGVFLFYAVVSLLGTFFVYFCLPETLGKTLQEIEDYFEGKQEQNLNVDESVHVIKINEILDDTKINTLESENPLHSSD